MFVFFLLVARMLEQRARNIASAQVDALARARPVIATRELADGSREAVPVAALRVDDVLRVSAGDVVPADGDRKSTRLNSSHSCATRMPSSACKKTKILTTTQQSAR